MKKRHFILAALGLYALLGVSAIQAQENCKDPQTQTDMNICAGRSHVREDARLNQQYKALMVQLEPERRQALKLTQLAWLKFRDLQCELEAPTYEGGSISPMVKSGCLERLTQERNGHLKDMLETAAM